MVVHVSRNTIPIIDHCDSTRIAFFRCCKENGPGMGVAGVSKSLDDDVLRRPDVMDGLAALGFFASKANIAASEIVLNAKRRDTARRFDEVFKGALAHGNGYLAMPTARLSRMTTTLTWPGYCISFSMR